jgi:hypothetical protein
MTERWRLTGALTADEWQAIFAGASVLVTLVVATIALVQLQNYLREREDAARPYLVVDYKFRSILMYIEVRNLSGAVATDVRLSVDRPFDCQMTGRPEVLNKVFSGRYRIKQLAPGRSIFWTFDRAPDYFAGNFPRNYEVTATYSDPRVMRRGSNWKFWKPKHAATYVETFDLNIEQYGEASAEADRANELANVNRRNEARIERIAVNVEAAANALDQGSFRPLPIAGKRRARR